MTYQGLRQILFFFTVLLVSTSCSLLAQVSSTPIAEAKTSNSSEMVFRDKILDYAQEHVGTRYRSAGKTPGGFDCSGFVYHVMKEFDIRMAASSATQEHQGIKIKPKEALPGDLLFFRRSKKGRVFHVAMVLSNDDDGLTVIHSSSSSGVVIENIDESSYWRSKVKTARNVISK